MYGKGYTSKSSSGVLVSALVMTRVTLLLVAALSVALSVVGCNRPEETTEAEPELPAGEPAESDPLRQGFTQNPDPDTPGLPPPIPPFLNDAERAAARMMTAEITEEDAIEAQRELEALVEAFESEPGPELVDRLRETALGLAKRGRILHVGTDRLYADYLFPNPEADADANYKGKLVVLTGRIAPSNMKDFADGFKLIEQNPYVHDPLLLATDYELSFVECRLAQPRFQLLRDWQPIHFIAEVEGKKASDVILGRCIVL
ncbi:MAG: hypothetical protein BMS9Abin37_3050 [Acidobacteriota bacterium]|nr:MAG: hypothetical protein BMS9Abin37_3050 [Acidobacteriota bacterium]